MPDNSGYIPSINSKSTSQETLDRIMNVKRAKLDEMQNETTSIKDKKKAWSEVKAKAVNLQGLSKKLYGFESPFDDKIAKSTDENAFSATVAKVVDVGENSLEVLNKAKPHRIASKTLDKNYKVPAGNYSIMVGNEDIKVDFSGGTLDKFADEIKKDSKNRLKASVTFDTKNTQVLIIESAKTGAKNQILFNDEPTKKLFRDMNFFEDVPEYDRVVGFDKNNISVLSNIKREPVISNQKILNLSYFENFKINLSEKIPYKDKLVMEVDLKVTEFSKDEIKKEIPGGPNFSKKGDLNLFDIQVEGESPFAKIPALSMPEEKEPVTDNHFITILTNKRNITLPELEAPSETKTLRFEMRDIIEKDELLEAVIFNNNNTLKKIEVSNLRFFDDASKSKMRFKNELSRPEDSVILYNGLRINRDSNSIDDIQNGLTLHIYDKTRKEEKLLIDRDYEKIVGSITAFLKDFNGFIELINKETDTKPDAEGKKANFSGDYSLVSLGSRLRNIMMNAYKTKYGTELALLAQIGISTNETGSKSFDSAKLKGILEVDDKKFIDKMEKMADGVKELFGSDTNSDMLVDSGAAFEIESILKLYNTRSTGYFDNKDKEYDRLIEAKNKDITSYKDKLSEEEKKLKRDLLKMDKAMQELEENKKKFDNFNKQ